MMKMKKAHTLKIEEKPLVSVLIGSYNAERYIVAAVDSALAQTYANIEIIIIDDASTDKTRDLLEKYHDPRIRYLVHEKNRGITGTRNHLFQEAKGAFFAYLDCDDLYLPDHVAVEVAYLEAHPRCALVYSRLLYFFDGNQDKHYRHRNTLYSGDDVFPALLEKMFITNTSIMFRREIYDQLGGYRTETGIVEDWEYFLRMTHAGFRIEYLDEDLSLFRLRWDSNTNFSRQVEIKDSQVKIFEDLKTRLTEQERRKYAIDYWIGKRKENLVVALLSDGKKVEARRVYQEIYPSVSLKKRIVIFFLNLAPVWFLRFAIEQGWNWKKRNTFVPIKQ